MTKPRVYEVPTDYEDIGRRLRQKPPYMMIRVKGMYNGAVVRFLNPQLNWDGAIIGDIELAPRYVGRVTNHG